MIKSSLFLLLAVAASALRLTKDVHLSNPEYAGPGGGEPDPILPQSLNPIIAIMTTPLEDCAWDSRPNVSLPAYQHLRNLTLRGCTDGFSLRWLASQGIRAVPVYWDDPWDNAARARLGARAGGRRTIRETLAKVNGVLLPGGGLDSHPAILERYIVLTQRIINYASKEHPGFLVWGTCQGYQILSMATLIQKNDYNRTPADICPCKYKGMWPMMLPLQFPSPYEERRAKSVLLGRRAESPEDIVSLLKHANTTVHYHRCGIEPELFEEPDDVRRDSAQARPPYIRVDIKLNVLAIGHDTIGQPFVSAWEAVNESPSGPTENPNPRGLNIFAVQFHPERPPYEFGYPNAADADSSHSDATLSVTTYFARFLRERLRLAPASHHYPSAREAMSELIELTAVPVHRGWGKITWWHYTD